MLLGIYQTLLVFAFLATYVTLTRRLDERLGAFPTMLLWSFLALSAFNVETAVDTKLVSVQHTALAFLCIGGAILMLVFGLAAVTGRLPDQGATRYARDTIRQAFTPGVDRREPPSR
ncbi:hypothetical protein [Halomarina pelagica]|uniref:hypothetical protein n=1 Tax=Halomarina pelagica TaxID=2961599 RepID=UPI0020C1F421|nr:hypothetical protein [Halomarina sp. BND7]